MLHLGFTDEVPSYVPDFIFDVAARMRVNVAIGDRRFEVEPVMHDQFARISGSEYAGCLTAEFGDSKVVFRCGAVLAVEAMLLLASVHPSKG